VDQGSSVSSTSSALGLGLNIRCLEGDN